MDLLALRHNTGKDSSVGILVDAETYEFYAYTCEDEHRDVKVAGETRIPDGRYEIKFNTTGGMNKAYSERYGDLHKGMLELQDVPNFTHIYIHTGNNDKHTAGCILVGYNAATDRSFGGGHIGNSRAAYRDIYKTISSALLKGEPVFITVTTLVALLKK